MRLLLLLTLLIVLDTGARAQAFDSTSPPAAQSSLKFDFDPGISPLAGYSLPNLNSPAAKPNDSLLSGLDLGGSRLNFEGDRKPPTSQVGAEAFEPGTIMSKKSRKIGPNFFGLSIRKSLE